MEGIRASKSVTGSDDRRGSDEWSGGSEEVGRVSASVRTHRLSVV